MYVVVLKHVPGRDDWIANKNHDKNKPDPEIPAFVPKSDLSPHLIEFGQTSEITIVGGLPLRWRCRRAQVNS
jgi:hypothetical protein